MFEDIFSKIKNMPSDGLVYLADPINETAGFFVCNEELIYAALSNSDGTQEHINTELLHLSTNVQLRTIEPSNHYKDGIYNLIRVSGNASHREITAFINLCITHAQSEDCQSFTDFFYSLIELFKLPSEQSKKSAVGLYGELWLITLLSESFNTDISEYWQKSGINSKYDFTFDQFNIEVKSTVSDKPIVYIKHDQLFNFDKNYLFFVQIEKNTAGKSIKTLADALRKSDRCLNGLHSQMILEKELLQVNDDDLETLYSIRSSNLFDVADIEFLKDIDRRISDMQYSLNLGGVKAIDLVCIINQII